MLTRIDPATNGVTASVAVGSWPQRLAYAGGSVWVCLPGDSIVVRVSATTNAVLNRVILDFSEVESLAATERAVWAIQGFGEVARIAY
jgi:virginiamycin B lyase